MDWKTIGNYVLLVGLFVTVVTMFNGVNARLDTMQAETNRRLDVMQAETNRRLDAMQAENNRRFDAMLEAIMGFDRRVSRNEGQIEVIREQLQAEGAP